MTPTKAVRILEIWRAQNPEKHFYSFEIGKLDDTPALYLKIEAIPSAAREHHYYLEGGEMPLIEFLFKGVKW
jgi:hypothetical protein